MNQIDTREGAKRRHRVIGLFAVIQCWIKGLDGVVFQRSQLERLLGMQRFKKPRKDWLIGNLREYFEYRQPLVDSKRKDSLASLFVSRLPLKPYFPHGAMQDQKRIEEIANQGGPKLAVFEMWQKPDFNKFEESFGSLPFLADYWNFDERALSSYIALIAQGQVSAKSMLPKKPKQK